MARLSVLSALALATAAAARTLWTDLRDKEYTYSMWLEEFKSPHVGSQEVFEANLAKIRAHNADASQTWKAGVNKFSALTPAQFKQVYAGYKRSTGALARASAPAAHEIFPELSALQPVSALPASLDWRSKGVVTPVKDQGMCGGCWSFSSAETSESHVAIATGKLFVFSEQQILSCSTNPLQCGGTGGCSGATQEIGFNYSAMAGLTPESVYPYEGVTGKCDKAKIKPVAGIKGYTFLEQNNYTVLMNALVQLGPVAISAAAEPWQSYEEGVFSSPCGTDVDHAIQLVGYGTDPKAGDYWLVRNSWSTGWGEQGYIRVARYGSTPSGEPCGVDKTPGDGDGCKGGPSTETVCGLCGIMSDSSIPFGGHLVS